ncbi:hypothetical protein C4D60_Mb10t19040 [Musa balbisiana]|uniref:Uncharacterized protein n=1 Tax=Musa balbisiana TaxID=52838 RepID=A0A4S8IZ38_MUSBA|nr:hypothetical protein C4D60_Mb10t19040 [Musa balbisiana]
MELLSILSEGRSLFAYFSPMSCRAPVICEKWMRLRPIRLALLCRLQSTSRGLHWAKMDSQRACVPLHALQDYRR